MTTAEMLRSAASIVRDTAADEDSDALAWGDKSMGDTIRAFADALEQHATECDDAVKLLTIVHPVHPQPDICAACKFLGRS